MRWVNLISAEGKGKPSGLRIRVRQLGKQAAVEAGAGLRNAFAR